MQPQEGHGWHWIGPLTSTLGWWSPDEIAQTIRKAGALTGPVDDFDALVTDNVYLRFLAAFAPLKARRLQLEWRLEKREISLRLTIPPRLVRFLARWWPSRWLPPLDVW